MKDSKQVILFAHGSSDAQWRGAVESLREELSAEIEGEPLVAFMERATPILEDVVSSSYGQSRRSFLILPLFLAPGGHMTHDVLPLIERLRHQYSDATFEVHSTLLENPDIRHVLVEGIKQNLVK
jgi:sirohydrochlorin cobaltochelatase